MTLTLTLTKTLPGSTWVPMPSLVLIGPAVRPAIGNIQTHISAFSTYVKRLNVARFVCNGWVFVFLFRITVVVLHTILSSHELHLHYTVLYYLCNSYAMQGDGKPILPKVRFVARCRPTRSRRWRLVYSANRAVSVKFQRRGVSWVQGRRADARGRNGRFLGKAQRAPSPPARRSGSPVSSP